MAILMALSVGCLNASQTVQGKFIVKNNPKYGVLNITADTVFIFIILTSLISFVNILSGSSSLSWSNLGLIFVSSSLGMICWLVGQNCSIKGRAGPTIAIIYTGCFFTTAFQVVFLSIYPTLAQISAACFAFIGVVVIIFGKETVGG